MLDYVKTSFILIVVVIGLYIGSNTIKIVSMTMEKQAEVFSIYQSIK